MNHEQALVQLSIMKASIQNVVDQGEIEGGDDSTLEYYNRCSQALTYALSQLTQLDKVNGVLLDP